VENNNAMKKHFCRQMKYTTQQLYLLYLQGQ